MICVIQRVSSCTVVADGALSAEQGKGFLLLLGVAEEDAEADADALARKIARLRVFEDDDGRMNKSVTDVCGEITVVSNFTLLAAYKKGNRPDFFAAAKPDKATALYEYFKSTLTREFAELGADTPVHSGVFGADMKITAALDGPVTINMDSKVLLTK